MALLQTRAASAASALGKAVTHLYTAAAGYWKPVAHSLQLTDDQKAALKMCWARVKANKAALTEEHSALSERLQLLQLRQQQVQLEFEEQAAQLHDLQLPYGVQQRRRFTESASQQQQQQQQHRASQQEELHHGSANQQLQQTSSVGMLQQQPVAQPDVLQEQQQQQVVYIPVLTGLQHQAADARLQELQPAGACRSCSQLVPAGAAASRHPHS
jgi:ATP-dependent protease HslVU (ClpYQ) ATPase subunit